MSRTGKSVQIEHRLMAASGCEWEGMGSGHLMDTSVPFRGDENVLELERGNSCTAVLMDVLNAMKLYGSQWLKW